MKRLYRSGLSLITAIIAVAIVCSAQQSPLNSNSTATYYSGTTTNAKAVSWDDPVIVDGRILRLRDVWSLVSALADNSVALNLRIPERQTPVSSLPAPLLPMASQRCGSQVGPLPNPACSQLQLKHPTSATKPRPD
jgi:hypothetical protein